MEFVNKGDPLTMGCAIPANPPLVLLGPETRYRGEASVMEQFQKRSEQPIAEYVVGYCFNALMTQVVLIEKLKPLWQFKKLNGVGGRVEPGETPREAMSREFQEETGSFIAAPLWLHIRTEFFSSEQEAVRKQQSGAKVHHFAVVATTAMWLAVGTCEAERIVKVNYPLRKDHDQFIYNLPYLIPMAAILLQQPPENRPLP